MFDDRPPSAEARGSRKAAITGAHLSMIGSKLTLARHQAGEEVT